MEISKKIKIIDLFSGIGGFHYAAEQVWDKVECVLHCEIDPFCQKVLKKHWPDTPIVSDIHDLMVDSSGNVNNNLKGKDEKGESAESAGGRSNVDLLVGGFP